jgi:hypothetical protein
MPERYKLNERGTKRFKPSRKQAKQRFIYNKNRCKSSVYGVKGIYWSYHVNEGVMSWIDVYFPSKFHKGRYFSAALITCEMKGIDDDQNAMFKAGEEAFPNAKLDMQSVLIPPKNPNQERMWEMKLVEVGDYASKREFMDAYEKKLNEQPRMIAPSIEIDNDYWYPAIGLHGVVNTPSLTEAAVIEFIEMFQALGEPVATGIVWTGEEVEVVPSRISERHAQLRSNSVKTDLD